MWLGRGHIESKKVLVEQKRESVGDRTFSTGETMCGIVELTQIYLVYSYSTVICCCWLWCKQKNSVYIFNVNQNMLIYLRFLRRQRRHHKYPNQRTNKSQQRLRYVNRRKDKQWKTTIFRTIHTKKHSLHHLQAMFHFYFTWAETYFLFVFCYLSFQIDNKKDNLCGQFSLYDLIIFRESIWIM